VLDIPLKGKVYPGVVEATVEVPPVGLPYEQGPSLLMGQHVGPLKRGEIAALVAAVALSSPLVAGLTRQMEIRLLPLDDAAIATVLGKDPALHPEVIPKGSYTRCKRPPRTSSRSPFF
jgi:TRAP-type uncharacterized transport system substrate-binding protein